MKFTYSLETVLDFRQRQQEEQKRKLAELSLLKNREQQKLQALRRQLMASGSGKPEDIRRYLEQIEYWEQILFEIDQVRAELIKMSEAEAEARRELAVKRIECKKLERHRRKKMEEFRREKVQAEQKQLDDWAARAFLLNREAD